MCKINRILSSAGVETGKALPPYQAQCLSVRPSVGLWVSKGNLLKCDKKRESVVSGWCGLPGIRRVVFGWP